MACSNKSPRELLRKLPARTSFEASQAIIKKKPSVGNFN